MHQSFTDQSKSEFRGRLRNAATTLHHHGNCTRQEIFTYCLQVAPDIYQEILSTQGNVSGTAYQPEEIIAEVIGEVISGYPS